MTIKILKSDGTWQVISGGGSGTGSDVYFSQILGLPTDNTGLTNALNSKLNNNLGTTEAGKVLKVGADGTVTATTTPVVTSGKVEFP